MKKSKQAFYKTIWYAAAFVFLFIWFTRIHPLVPYDGDDWLYLSYARRAIPLWKDWNPARVLPEVLMPLCGAVAAYVVTPLTGDYIGSITLVSAALVSGCIVVYLRCFGTLMERRFSVSAASSVLLSVLFLTLHFLVMRSQNAGNNYLFFCWELTCYYYYLIPALLNCSLVMWMMAGGDGMLAREGSPEKKGLFAAVVYFAIFSNLPGSVILAIYAGVQMFLAFVKERKTPHFWKVFLRQHMTRILIVAAWGLSAVFELAGGRASDDMGYRLPLMQGLKGTLYRFLALVFGSNKTFLLFAGAVAVGVMALLAITKKKDVREREFLSASGELLLCGALTLAAAVILCVKVDVTYITRSEYVFGVYFYGFLLLLSGLVYLLRREPKLLLALPVLLCILISDVNTAAETFPDSNLQGCSSEVCKAIDNDLIHQLRTAVEAGQTEMTLHVPVSGRSTNWPHASYVGNRIAVTLHEHGVLTDPIQVTVKPDPEINEKYNLPLPEGG